MFGHSWKTTAMGAVLILWALLGAAYGVLNSEPVDWNVVAAKVATGVGLIMAKDFNVTGGGK